MVKVFKSKQHLAREDSSFLTGRSFQVERTFNTKKFVISKWANFQDEVERFKLSWVGKWKKEMKDGQSFQVETAFSMRGFVFSKWANFQDEATFRVREFLISKWTNFQNEVAFSTRGFLVSKWANFQDEVVFSTKGFLISKWVKFSSQSNVLSRKNSSFLSGQSFQVESTF